MASENNKKFCNTVSVIVLSYNCGGFIKQTLDSIAGQTYGDIEVIICDDCSNDDCCDVIRGWAIENGGRFKRIVLHFNEANLGICRNLDCGIKLSRGGWIKPIAGDDIMLPDALDKFVETAKQKGADVVFSQMLTFCNNCEGEIVVKSVFIPSEYIKIIERGSLEILKTIYQRNILPAPSAMYSRQAFERSGGIDMDFRNLDDWPLWIRMLEAGVSLYWIEKPLILYRIHSAGVSQTGWYNPVKSLMLNDKTKFYQKYQSQKCTFAGRIDLLVSLFRAGLFARSPIKGRLIYYVIGIIQLLSPLTWIRILSFLRSTFGFKMVRNILPVFLGFFYFGFYGLSRLVRVYGRLHIRANRKTIILGKKIKIYPGVSFVGNGEADELIQIGNSVVIESNAYLNTHGGKIEIGDGVHIGFGVVLQGKGSVIIGDHSMLGPYVQCYSSNHRQSESFIPRALLGEKKQQIQVGNNSWIGANSVLLPGVSLGCNTLLPAGTVRRRTDEPFQRI